MIGANAQIGVNAPLPQSTLEVKATSQENPTALDGLLIPRVDKFTNTDPGQDQHSMIVFLTKEITHKTKLYAIGYYYWDATKTDWIKLTDANTAIPKGNGWFTNGNIVDDTAFLETTNDKDIVIKRDNQLYGKWQRDNVSLGFESMLNNKALSNTAMGYRTLYTNTTGEKNTAIGFSALWFNTTGSSNIALGDTALAGNTTSNGNVAIGNNALKQFTGGTGNSYNTAVGYNVLTMNKNGHYNTAVGSNALQLSLAEKNTAIGANALNENLTGVNNIGVGISTLKGNKAGSNNIHIGNADANTGRDNIENTIVIGNNVGDGSILDNTIFIGGPNMQYFISNTQMGVYSDKRFKEESKQQVPGLAFITKLRPVTYYLDYDKLNKFKGGK